MTWRGLDATCPTGICVLGLEAARPGSLTVSMFYGSGEPFTKIEGAYAVGGFSGAVDVLGGHRFRVSFAGGEREAEIQVVDYMRN